MRPLYPAANYYPFGTVMSGRTWSAETSYRYGFNGFEIDDDLSGGSSGTLYRPMNSRLGQWLTPDPESASFPGMSPFSLMGNNPLYNIDLNGDKIRGSIGMRFQILKFKIATSRNMLKATRSGNTGLAQVYNRTLDHLESLKSSDVVFHFHKKHFKVPEKYSESHFEIKANPSRHRKSGQVDVLISDNNPFMSLAGATA